jgi:hypothetical protein
MKLQINVAILNKKICIELLHIKGGCGKRLRQWVVIPSFGVQFRRSPCLALSLHSLKFWSVLSISFALTYY